MISKALNIKPCPFCGGAANLYPILQCLINGESQTAVRIGCVCGVTTGTYLDIEDCIKHWNRRTNENQ